MNPSLHVSARRFAACVAGLDFSAQLPADWIEHDVVENDADFSDPSRFTPLAVLTAPHAAIVLAVAARPAYDDGTLHDWAWYVLNHNQLAPRAVGRSRVAGVGAVVGEAVQPSDLGPMLLRFAFLEDADRLLNLTLTAPELLACAVQPAWRALLASFTLEQPRGSRFPVEPHPDDAPAAPMPEPWLHAATAAPATPAFPRDAESGEPLFEPSLQRPLSALTGTRRTRLADFALCDDSIALDEDHPLNRQLGQHGMGRIPDIAGLSDSTRLATLAAEALGAEIDVPYGWHVFDDGRRTLVLEPGGQVRVEIDLLDRAGRDTQQMLDALEAGLRARHPEARVARRAAASLDVLELEDLADNEQPLLRCQLLRGCPDETKVLCAQVTATTEHADWACNLAELVVQGCVLPALPVDGDLDDPDAPGLDALEPGCDANPPATASRHDTFDNAPAWWHEALDLEAQGHPDAAEVHIRTHCPFIGYAQATAEMYRRRMGRLQAAGDAQGALDAFLKSSDFIWRYASMATSGGEGAALSMERDAFRAQLVAEYGSDPEAPTDPASQTVAPWRSGEAPRLTARSAGARPGA